MVGAKPLTELEGGVLALIQQRGPCTSYAIRQEFLASSTPHWSGSAGAIYPLVERLTQRRLIRVLRPTPDGRGGKLLVLTGTGRRALFRWLGPPFSDLTLGVPPDPIRTRVGFLEILPRPARLPFLNEVVEKFQLDLAKREAEAANETDPFERMALRGSYLVMQARLVWAKEIAAALAASELAGEDRRPSPNRSPRS
jgi:DNA-binding PadR family transcriptional regulator